MISMVCGGSAMFLANRFFSALPTSVYLCKAANIVPVPPFTAVASKHCGVHRHVQKLCWLLCLYMVSITVCNGVCWAQSDSTAVVASKNPTAGQTFAADLSAVGSDAGAYVFAPLSWSEREWLYAAGILGSSVLVMVADKDISAWIHKQETPAHDEVSAFAKLYGEKTYAALFALSAYTAGHLFCSDDIRVTGRLIGESLVFAGITTQAVKMLAGRSRPSRGEGVWFFAPLQTDNGRMSLSSGHTAVAFAVSSVLSERIGNMWASVGLYSLASMTALSRVYDGEHWLSDVLVGAAIGTSAGIAVTAWEAKRTEHSQKGEAQTLLLFPTPNGVLCVYRW